MSFWTAAVVIVAILALVEVIKSKHRFDKGITRDVMGNETPPQPPLREDADARREIEELRERVRVLERIATDNHSLEAQNTRAIADQIESLRDKA